MEPPGHRVNVEFIRQKSQRWTIKISLWCQFRAGKEFCLFSSQKIKIARINLIENKDSALLIDGLVRHRSGENVSPKSPVIAYTFHSLMPWPDKWSDRNWYLNDLALFFFNKYLSLVVVGEENFTSQSTRVLTTSQSC